MAADISEYIKQIESASRGEEVRDSIINALNAIKDYTAGEYDTNTTYTFSYANGTLTITPSEGDPQEIAIGGSDDSGYTFDLTGNNFIITPKNGDPIAFDLSTVDPGYTLEKDGTTIKLMRNNTEVSSVDVGTSDDDVMSTYF